MIKTRRVPCFNPNCWSRRIHFERPNEPRGQQMVEVPFDWDGNCAFCSFTCAAEAGYMPMNESNLLEGCCEKCFVRGHGFIIHHRADWVCASKEVTEEEFQKEVEIYKTRLANSRFH